MESCHEQTLTALHLPLTSSYPLDFAAGVLTEPINAALAHLLPVLNSLRRHVPSTFATSLLGMTEVHSRWRSFVAERRHLAPNHPLRFSAADLTGCFDTIAQPRLFQAIQFALRLAMASTTSERSPSASTASSSRVLIPKRFRVYHPSANRLLARSMTEVCSGRTAADSLRGAQRLAACGTSHGALFHEMSTVQPQSSRTVLAQMREHIFCNLVAIDGLVLVQRMGIPQGSILSAMFCSLHYAAYEHAMLARYLPMKQSHTRISNHSGTDSSCIEDTVAVESPRETPQVQLRLIDDTLHVCLGYDGADNGPATDQLLSFGSIVNTCKARSYPAPTPSIPCDDSVSSSRIMNEEQQSAVNHRPLCWDGRGHQYFAWCGWLIDVRTLEVRPDFAKARMVVARDGRPHRLRSIPPSRWQILVCKALKPKLHRAFLDPQVCAHKLVPAIATMLTGCLIPADNPMHNV